MGNEAGYNITTESNNLCLGASAGYKNTGPNNMFIGTNAGKNNTTGSNNMFIGNSTGFLNTIGYSNVYMGNTAGYYSTEGYQNICIGDIAGHNITTGFNNLLMGNQSGYNITTQTDNVCIGNQAGYNTTTNDNIFIGSSSGKNNTTGTANLYLGKNAGLNATDGSDNIAIGQDAGSNIISSDNNIFIGYQSGNTLTTGTDNVIIGYDADVSGVSGTNQIVIGSGAIGPADNTVVIGNSSITDIYMASDSSATVRCGKLLAQSSTNSADVIKLHAYAGELQTITIVNDEGTNASAISITASAGGITIDASSDLDLNSSGGVINVGNDDVAQNINIGTGASTRTITLGNATGATAVSITSGTGNIALASTGTGGITINSDDTLLLDADGVLELNSSAGAINIGNDAVAQEINIGSGVAARTIQIGNAASTATNLDALAINLTSVNALSLTDGIATFLLGGTGATSLSAATTVALDCTGDMSLNSSGGAINVGDDAVAQSINIGTGAAAKTITIGNDAYTKVDINALEIELDSAAAMTLSSVGALDIDTVGSASINIGTQYAAKTINVGNANGATAVAITAGTGSIALSSSGEIQMSIPDTSFFALLSDGNYYCQAGDLNLVANGTSYISSSSGLILITGTATVSGGGFDAATTNMYVSKINGEIVTTIIVDIGGGSIVSSSDAGDVIGENGVANSYITKLTSAVNGIVYKAEMACLELPTTGDADINLTANTSGTIAEDADGESGGVVLINAGTHAVGKNIVSTSGTTFTAGLVNYYLYLTHGGTTAGTYGAGQFIIKLYGCATI